ncbi:FadR/GntR family transcriptional regulator [Desulfovibrio sp. Fe33]|uniref:FadR/GntR family transcriptional regulator n=1 Tax=Desulfovibrio sp. Fe33 TaxID=3020842 RepID=UPI00234D5B09|nr:FCD domain-containing protein [Desulfovibrio sp. Fe33]
MEKQIVVKQSRKEAIVAKIKREILLQQYVPGDALPREEALSKRYASSRAVIREALGALKAQGYLESRRGKNGGTFVRDVIESCAMGDLFGDLILMGQMKIDDLLTARLLIEPEAARLAAMKASPMDLQKLADLNDMAVSQKATLRRVRHNAKFHIQLGQLSGNPFYDVSIRSFMSFTIMFTEMLGDSTPYVHDDDAHHNILEALQSRNPQLVFERMYVHVSGLKAAMVSQEKLLRDVNLR